MQAVMPDAMPALKKSPGKGGGGDLTLISFPPPSHPQKKEKKKKVYQFSRPEVGV